MKNHDEVRQKFDQQTEVHHKKTNDEVILISAQDMQPQSISWLWKGWIAEGIHQLIDGDQTCIDRFLELSEIEEHSVAGAHNAVESGRLLIAWNRQGLEPAADVIGEIFLVSWIIFFLVPDAERTELTLDWGFGPAGDDKPQPCGKPSKLAGDDVQELRLSALDAFVEPIDHDQSSSVGIVLPSHPVSQRIGQEPGKNLACVQVLKHDLITGES